MNIKGPKRCYHIEIQRQHPLEGYDFVESFWKRELAVRDFILLKKDNPSSFYRIIQVLSEA